MDFLELKKNTGQEELRTRDLFLALWIPDLFMKQVKDDGDWYLFCPHESPGLNESHSKEFEKLYNNYVAAGKYRRKIKARTLWTRIIESQVETGTPYMLFKDAANSKSNQQNLGTIQSSNLCTEIIEYTAPDEVAVCNLASVALPKFVKEDKTFDHERLFQITYTATRNLNRIIDRNYYPIKEARNSNMRHRPIGLGVQGLADTFVMMRIAFDSDEAKKLNKEIFETIYYAALTCSKDLAKTEGHYESFPGSPASQGVLQYDMWKVQPSNRWEWDLLKDEIKQYGLRNSLLLAPMPTASTAQILGNNECFEPFTSNMYMRRVLSGEFPIVNKHLLRDLVQLGLWSNDMKNKIMIHNGSIQNIDEIPDNIKDIYKTVWEIKQKDLIDMAADRGAFIDQSQSLNIFMESPTYAKMTSLHFYAWEKGLKTGMYYLRSKAGADAVQFTVDKSSAAVPSIQAEQAETHTISEEINPEVISQLSCSLDNPEGCEACGS